MKKTYERPVFEKIEFNFSQTILASGTGGKNPAQCQNSNPGWGCGHPGENLGNDSPGNCTIDGQRKQPHQCT